MISAGLHVAPFVLGEWPQLPVVTLCAAAASTAEVVMFGCMVDLRSLGVLCALAAPYVM